MRDHLPAVLAYASIYASRHTRTHTHARAHTDTYAHEQPHKHVAEGRDRYYAVCFLNQIELMRTDQEPAGKLIAIYFHFFQARLAK
jgi:hypothetical protein